MNIHSGLSHCTPKRRHKVYSVEGKYQKRKEAHSGRWAPDGQQTKMYGETSSSVRWCESDGFQPSHDSFAEPSNDDRSWKDLSNMSGTQRSLKLKEKHFGGGTKPECCCPA